MPVPSAACEACKRRRIKCDETKPACLNCKKSQRICLDANAVKQTNFSIHVENDFASGKSKRPRGPRSVLSKPRPQDDLQTRALTYYLNIHTQSPLNTPYAPGCLYGSISSWKLAGRSSPMVDLALSALSLVIYARTHQQPAAAEEASRIYYRLLRIMQDRIGELSDIEDFDAWLLTILLMGRYEGAVHGPADFELVGPLNQLRNWVHDDGAQAVLKLWKEKAEPVPATFIVTQARRTLIRISFLRDLALPDWMLDGAQFGEKDLELQFDRVEVQLTNLRHATTCLEKEDHLDLTKAHVLNKQAKELDQALQAWVVQIPSKYSHKVHTIHEDDHWPKRHFYSPTVYSFSKPEYASAWLQYFSTRMLIHSTWLRILSRLSDETYEMQATESKVILISMTNNLAFTVPFVLGRFRIEGQTSAPTLGNEKEEINPGPAMILIWPLSVASGLKGVDRRQQLWFRSELACLGKILGDGIIESAESENWITF